MLYYYVYLRAGGVPTRHTHEGGLHTRYLLESTHTNTHKHTQTQTNAQRGPTKYGAGSRLLYVGRLHNGTRGQGLDT